MTMARFHKMCSKDHVHQRPKRTDKVQIPEKTTKLKCVNYGPKNLISILTNPPPPLISRRPEV